MDPNKKSIIGVTYLSISMLGFFLSMYMVLRDLCLKYFNLNETISGLLVAVLYVGFMTGPLILGPYSDKHGKDKAIKISIVLAILGTVSCGLSFLGIAFFVIGVFLCGAGFGTMEATMSALLCDEFPNETNKHLNLSQVGFSVGAVVSPIITRVLLDAGVAWYYMFFAIAIIMCGMFFWFSKVKIQKREFLSAEENTKPPKILIKQAIFMLMILSLVMYVAMEECQLFWQESFITEKSTSMMGALSITLFWVAMIPSRFAISFLKKGRFLLCAGFTFLTITFIGFGIIAQTGVESLVFFTIAGFFMGPVWATLMGIAADLNPKNSGTALNILMASGGLGGIVFPLLAGSAIDLTGLNYASFLMAILVGLIGITVILIARSLVAKQKGIKNM